MNRPPYSYFAEEKHSYFSGQRAIVFVIGFLLMFFAAVVLFSCIPVPAHAEGIAWQNYSNDAIANAIFHAENSTRHPYGILTRYKHTTPRQACINTIKHARRDWNGKGDFISFLGARYCPPSAHPLNKNWVRNVKHFLEVAI